MVRRKQLQTAGRLLLYMISYIVRTPKVFLTFIALVPLAIRGFIYGHLYQEPADDHNPTNIGPRFSRSINPLEEFLNNRTVGRGIWKWVHYFEIYHRHFSKFVGQQVNIVEIGVFSGGSLEMWREYFGEKCRIYGVDIAEACRVFSNEYTKIFIGDQEDREFWRNLRAKVSPVDILIDDGGHSFGQQIVTLEEMLPYIKPGGVYVCEDIHGIDNGFNSFCQGLIKNLNEMTPLDPAVGFDGGMRPNCLQTWIKGIYLYPYIVVIEKSERPIEKLICPKHGTIWQPI